jgi:hypothetical protein
MAQTREYDVVVYHVATGPVYRAGVRLKDDDTPDFSSTIHGASTITKFTWRDDEGVLHQFQCNGEMSYSIIPRWQELIVK